MENVALWHERDISHSSVERVIMPDSTILIDYMLARITDRHQASGGLSRQHAAQPRSHRRAGLFATAACCTLIEKGAQRKESYEAVQRNAMASWKGAGGLQELVGKDPFVSKHLTEEEIASCFDPKYYLRHLDQIFRRVFGRKSGSAAGKRTGRRRQ